MNRPPARSGDRADRRRRRAVPALAGLLFFAVMAALYLSGMILSYQAIIRLWGIVPFAYPFVDTDTVLSAVRCLRAGVDVYVANPCDPLGRVFDYSPLWMLLALLPLGIEWLPRIGFAVDLAFLLSLLLLPAGRRWRDTMLIALGVLSSGTLFAVERANNDLILFVLAAGAAALVCRSPALRLVGYGLAFLAGLLKYYPMTLMALATRERPPRFFAVAAGAMAVLALFVAVTWHDLTRVLELIPVGSFFGDMFGSITVSGGLARRFGLSAGTASAIHLAMAAASCAIGIALGLRGTVPGAMAALDERERSFLLAGALLILSCFFTAQNIGYRVVHLILALPALTALGGRPDGRLFRSAAIVALALLWSEAWRNGALGIGSLFGRGGLGGAVWSSWLLREALWWWLVTLLIGCVTAILLQSEMGQRMLAIGRRPVRLSATP